MWPQLVIDTLLRPREAAQRVLALPISVEQVLLAGVGVTCLGMVLAFLTVELSPGGVDAVSAMIIGNPLIGALAEFLVMLVVAFLVYRIGGFFGGSGSLPGALALVVWLNVMMVMIQVVQVLVLMILPPLAAVIALATLFWAFWAFTNFVAELHGFQNPMFVMGAVILTAIVLFFALASVFAFLGFVPQEMN